MTTDDLANEIVLDLLRSAWVIEKSRGSLYERWARVDERFGSRVEATEKRAALLATRLDAMDADPDGPLVDTHAAWLAGIVGERPDEIALGPLFVVRLGDWVDAHSGPFLGSEMDDLKRWGEQEKEALEIPGSLPEAPPFEPVPPVEVQLPGEVLFRFALLGDTHIGSRGAETMTAAALRDIESSGAAFVIQLGDITDHGEKEEFDRARSLLDTLSIPVTTMMGNHDVYSMNEERLSGREYYGSVFGREPDGVMFEHAGFRFAVLDSIEHGASPFGPFDLVSGRLAEGSGGAIVRGSLTTPQHELLADIAAPGGQPTFVFLHHPPQPFTGFPPILFGLRDSDSGRLHAVVDSGNVWGVFAGHTHRNARTRDFDGVPAQEVAIPRDYPFGYALVDVCREGYVYRFHQISDEELLRKMYKSATTIHRRYGRGDEQARGFVWTRT